MTTEDKAAREQREPYNAPLIVVLGSVEELTHGVVPDPSTDSLGVGTA